jgi:hypothetical protein
VPVVIANTSSFPQSPRLLKGALISIGIPPSVVVFQYNPDALTRTLKPASVGSDNEPLRLKAPPDETIKLDAMLDAADQLEADDTATRLLGLHPQLAALELMLYPPSAQVIVNEVLAAVGMLEIIPPSAPLTFLFWGLPRVVPVRITDMSITEDAFDPKLNPLHAKVSISMRVLNYAGLGVASPGGAMFMAHQLAKELMASAVFQAVTEAVTVSPSGQVSI